MIDVEASRRFDQPPAMVWSLVADPGRLAEWVPTASQSQPAGNQGVHLSGQSHGHPYELDARLDADGAARRLEWAGSGGGYRGWLQVTEAGPGSTVHLHISVPEDKLAASDDHDGEIRRGIEAAFDRLAALLKS